MKYLQTSAVFLSFGLLTVFFMQIIQEISDTFTIGGGPTDAPINYWASSMILVPLAFGALFIITFALGMYQIYQEKKQSKK
ncbi:hypothetical protein [Lentilactobacillus buchneri]|uniref:Group-specific protein n=1 Tax=Lentilactobacillus buchneri subsp. silagei CD034 TaxID=1071400 RepID=J9W591_LENBU|nr:MULTISPECIES: hypothetical protein [Lentilactobacillus]MCC6100896.1 hypothetical protein [Lactobacillus sp.]AFR99410.1 hypothetical protein LBUCD034_0305 [Lentilactobacillus buchneri subsp. silagei CD034]MCT2900840.1 hypothetical protein [Lentilactobacillus buchneri]MCT3542277.1 hypothetical protein [Lentilactobacillus buchneri]MCT3546106.1 hypothetical protein [Lentilactobacillus buchneri]